MFTVNDACFVFSGPRDPEVAAAVVRSLPARPRACGPARRRGCHRPPRPAGPTSARGRTQGDPAAAARPGQSFGSVRLQHVRESETPSSPFVFLFLCIVAALTSSSSSSSSSFSPSSSSSSFFLPSDKSVDGFEFSLSFWFSVLEIFFGSHQPNYQKEERAVVYNLSDRLPRRRLQCV